MRLLVELKSTQDTELAGCSFTTKYYDIESEKEVDYYCDNNIDVLDLGLCIFHEKRYLEGFHFDLDHYGRGTSVEALVMEREKVVREQIMAKIENSMRNKKPLFCIGYNLPDNLAVK